MNSTPSPLDLVAVLIALAALLFDPKIAELVGPYAAICLGAVLGAAWSASRRPVASRNSNTALYIAFFVALAVLVTVPLAEFAAEYLPSRITARVLIPFVAFAISAVGPDWPGVLRWAVSVGRGAVERRVGVPPSDLPPPPSGGAQ